MIWRVQKPMEYKMQRFNITVDLSGYSGHILLTHTLRGGST